jgi:hypothetical protein
MPSRATGAWVSRWRQRQSDKLAQLAWEEIDAIKKAKEDAEKAELAAMQKKQKEEYERKLAEEEEVWQKQLPKLRENAGKLDASGL